MALPLLPLLLGGLALGDRALSTRRERDQQRQRDTLQSGIQSALGSAPSIFTAGEARPGESFEGFQTGGSGLLADPNNQANQLRFASNIFGLPGGASIGAGLLEQSLGFGQQTKQQQSLFGQQDTQQQNEFGFKASQNQLDRMQKLDLANQKSRALFDANAAALAATGGANIGSIAAGHHRIETSPGQFADIPNRDTPRWTSAVDEIQGLETSVDTVGQMLESIKLHGSEAFGVESGNQAFIYGQLVSEVAKLRNLGVLTPGELEFVAEGMTDPSSFDGSFTGQERLEQNYQTLLEFMQKKIRDANQRYAYWGIGSQLDKTTPQQIAKDQADVALTASAQELGLRRTGATQRPEPIPAGTLEGQVFPDPIDISP